MQKIYETWVTIGAFVLHYLLNFTSSFFGQKYIVFFYLAVIFQWYQIKFGQVSAGYPESPSFLSKTSEEIM